MVNNILVFQWNLIVDDAFDVNLISAEWISSLFLCEGGGGDNW